MTFRAKRWLIIGLAVVAAAGGIGWLAQDRTGVSAPAVVAGPSPAAHGAGGSVDGDDIPGPREGTHTEDERPNDNGPSRDRSPLPPIDTPVAAILDELEARARAGDVRAACRLASELSRCGSVDKRLAMQVRQTESLAEQPSVRTDQQVDSIARFDLALELDQQACAGVTKARTREALRWLLVAARGRHAPSMTAFLAGGWFLEPASIHHVEVFAAYAREAESMAIALVEMGDPTVLRLLGMAYAEDHAYGLPHLYEVVTPDPVTARAMLALSLERAPMPRPAAAPRVATRSWTDPTQRSLERLDARLDATQRAEADALLARLRERVAPTPPPARPASGNRFYFALVQPTECQQ